MRKRILLMTVCVVFLLLNMFCSAQAESNYAQFRADIPDSFVYETTTVYGDHIAINVPIVLPDVSEIPVLRVGWNMNGRSIGRWIEASEDEEIEDDGRSKKDSGGYVFSFPLAEDQAPGIDVTMDEAARAVLDILGEKTPDVDYGFFSGYAESGAYLIPNNSTIDYDQIKDYIDSHDPVPGYEDGRYSLRIRQVLQGIPVFFQEYFCISNMGDPTDPCPRIMAIYAGQDDYKCYMETVHIDSMAIEDVSLTPYAEIEKQIRKYIDLGLIQQMDELELGYMLYYENEISASAPQSESLMLAIPTWRVSGYFSFGAYQGLGPDELPERTAWGATAEKKENIFIGNDCMRFDAITGRSLFAYENPAPRVYHLQEALKHD